MSAIDIPGIKRECSVIDPAWSMAKLDGTGMQGPSHFTRGREVFIGFMGCVAYAELDDDATPIGDIEGASFTMDCLVKCRFMVEEFLKGLGEAGLDELADSYRQPIRQGTVYERIGEYLWYTMGGHGLGFWDDEFGESPVAEKASELAHSFYAEFYVGDDGNVHIMGGHKK